ncbi:MAG: hypothetical protein Q9217_000904 [Psora testacea]
MEPWQNWAIACVLISGAAYYYSTTGGQKKRPSGFKPYIPKQTQRRNSWGSRNESKGKRKKEKEASGSDPAPEDTADVSAGSAPGSETDAVRKRKGEKKQQPSKLAQSSTVEISIEEEGMDNLEFAKQLSDKMTGTSLKKPDRTQHKKARGQAKRAEASMVGTNGNVPKPNGVMPLQENSTASSTTGADADDDLSSANSPELGATNDTTQSARDVSDMLEPPAKGPSVLILTEPVNPQPQRQPKAQKSVQESETKKQRQNRRKKEEQKAMREQAEKERLVALENQRRTVREAEGRPAKNGLGSSQAPSSNAWSSTSKAGQTDTNLRPAALRDDPLLDTFEESTPSTSAPGKHFNELPTEEEQMKILGEMESDNAWNTVSKGGKSKKRAVNAQASAANSATDTADAGEKGASNGVAGDVSLSKEAPHTSMNVPPHGVKPRQGATETGDNPSKPLKATRETIDHSIWNHSNIHEHPDYDPAFPYALTGHPEDSEWAVV